METVLEAKLEKKLKKQFGPSADEVRRLANAESDAAKEWQNDIDAGQPFMPSVGYWEAWEAWMQTYNARTLPYAQRAMQEMQAARKAFMELDNEFTPETQQYTELANKFLVTREVAQKMIFRNPRSRADWERNQKTPAQLNAEKVPLRQIAYEWLWKNEDGNPDLDRVQREIDHPGSELTEKMIEARYQFYLLQMGFVYVPPESDEDPSPAAKKPDVPPSTMVHHPSIEDFVRQRIGVEQIVFAKAAEYGIDKEAYESKERLASIATAVSATAAALGITLPANSREIIVAGTKPVAPAKFSEPEAVAS